MLLSWSQIDFHLIYSAQNPARLLNYSKGTILTNTIVLTLPRNLLQTALDQSGHKSIHFITLYRFHLSISISARGSQFHFKDIQGPIHWTFHSFCDEFHYNEFTIGNVNKWMIEWTMTSVIDQVRHMVWTHVPIPSFNVHHVVQASFTARKYGPNSLNISLFLNKFLGHSLQWIHYWKEDTTQEWLSELGPVLFTMRYMVCTHVPIPCFNLHFSTPTCQFHYKEMRSQFARHLIDVIDQVGVCGLYTYSLNILFIL